MKEVSECSRDVLTDVCEFVLDDVLRHFLVHSGEMELSLLEFVLISLGEGESVRESLYRETVGEVHILSLDFLCIVLDPEILIDISLVPYECRVHDNGHQRRSGVFSLEERIAIQEFLTQEKIGHFLVVGDLVSLSLFLSLRLWKHDLIDVVFRLLFVDLLESHEIPTLQWFDVQSLHFLPVNVSVLQLGHSHVVVQQGILYLLILHHIIQIVVHGVVLRLGQAIHPEKQDL